MSYDFQIDLGDLIPEYPLRDQYENADQNMCDECGKDEAQVGRHCFDCAGEMIREELGLPERMAA